MWIGEHPHPRHLRTPLLAPHASESQEVTLLRRIAVDLLILFSSLVFSNQMFQRGQRNAGTTIVRGILAESEPSIQFQIIDRHEVRIFICYAAHALFEFLAILLSPPVVIIP